jgi:hypothetical protein
MEVLSTSYMQVAVSHSLYDMRYAHCSRPYCDCEIARHLDIIVVRVLFGYETSFCRWLCCYQHKTTTREVIVQIRTCVETNITLRSYQYGEEPTTVLPTGKY